MRIVVAMSGGVDSSVAAAMLVRAGHDVIGLSMQLYDPSEGDARFGSCCTIDDLHDARQVAASLGIPHYLVNLQREFHDRVIADFIEEYANGRTPIPCVRCNGELKFATLVERARALGAGHVATGHYARIEHDEGSGRYVLRRGTDAAKDQSYFLFTLTQAQLSAAQFPLGELTKDAVRGLAHGLGLRVAEKPDSQEICFVRSGEHAAFVERRVPHAATTGVVVDLLGRVLGRHDGVHRFTVGQRKGLGLSASEPLYVVALDAETHRVTVGPRAALERTKCTASGVNWIAGSSPALPGRFMAQIRYRHQEAPARVAGLAPDRVAVEFEEPQTAIAPGQAIVFYDGDAVAGGGWID